MAFAMAPEPDDFDLDRAISLCRGAGLGIAAGGEAGISLARLAAHSCDLKEAYRLLQVAALSPSTPKGAVVTEWATLALRQGWRHGSTIERSESGGVALSPTRSTFSSTPLFLVGALRLREGALDRSRRLLEQAWVGRAGAERWALSEALVVTSKQAIDFHLQGDDLRRLVEPTVQELKNRMALVAGDGARIAELMSWISPEQGLRLLESLPPASTCADQLARAKLLWSLGTIPPMPSSLSLCQADIKWMDRCRAMLRKRVGSDDPLVPTHSAP
jgi:hypothetical protein